MSKAGTNDLQVNTRLATALVAELDELAARLSKPGMRITRASVMRMLLIEGLEKSRRADGVWMTSTKGRKR